MMNDLHHDAGNGVSIVKKGSKAIVHLASSSAREVGEKVENLILKPVHAVEKTTNAIKHGETQLKEAKISIERRVKNGEELVANGVKATKDVHKKLSDAGHTVIAPIHTAEKAVKEGESIIAKGAAKVGSAFKKLHIPHFHI